MRIGVDARPLTVPTFGIGRYTQEILSRLVNSDSDHEWFLYADRPLSGWRDVATVRDFKNHNRLFSLARTQLTFCHWAKLDKLDCFWSPRHHLPLAIDIPSVLTVHDVVWRKYPETMQRANLLVEKCLMPPSVQKADAVIAVSEATQRDVEAEFSIEAKKTKVIYEAAETKEAQVNFRDDAYFLFLGTNEPRKNLPRLLDAFSRYRERRGSCKLLVAGGAGWGGEILVRPEVELLGYVSEVELESLIRGCTALVMPSLYEGFGLPILEAIVRGVPVVTSNVSAMPEVAGEAGLLVDPYDVEQIADALTQISDPDLRSSLASKCPAQAEKFNWEDSARATLDVIEATAALSV